jgi:hypothetical protein
MIVRYLWNKRLTKETDERIKKQGEMHSIFMKGNVPRNKGLIKDIYRNKRLKELGYRILRFWEYEIYNDLKGCLDKIEGNLWFL